MTIIKKSRNVKLLCLILTMIFVISGFPSVALASELNEPDCCVVEAGNSFKVTSSVTSSWKNHANVDFTFTNTGDRVIHNWYFTFNLLYNIDNIWNARIIERDETGTYTICNSTWNQDIPVGSSVTVGMTLSSETEENLTVMPSWYLLNTTTKSVDAADYTITYQEQSSWDSGFTGALLLQPSINISDWSIRCSTTREITSISSAKMTDNGNGNYTISNDGNNQNISAGSSYYVGIQGNNNTAAFSLSSVTLTVVDLALTLHDDSNNNGIADYLEAIYGGEGEDPEVTPTATPTVTPEPTIEPTMIPTDVPTATPTTTPDTDVSSQVNCTYFRHKVHSFK